jgi:hypothetical protein
VRNNGNRGCERNQAGIQRLHGCCPDLQKPDFHFEKQLIKGEERELFAFFKGLFRRVTQPTLIAVILASMPGSIGNFRELYKLNGMGTKGTATKKIPSPIVTKFALDLKKP